MKRSKSAKRLWGTFTMAGFTVPVYLVPAETMEVRGEMGCAFGGSHKPTIHIHDGLKGEVFKNTLLHEMLHIAAYSSGVTMSERQVEGITAMLRQAFRTTKKEKV